MKRFTLAILGLLAVSLAAHAALRIGDSAPLFTARASLDGKAFDYSLADALKRGPVVVYFYPSAFTRGCNIQAHTFSEKMPAFDAAGASVIGVSLDSIERLNEFSADPEYCAGKVAVASDADGKITKSFRVPVRGAVSTVMDSRGYQVTHGFAERITFIVTPDGKVAATISGASPEDNVKQSLAAVESLKSGK